MSDDDTLPYAKGSDTSQDAAESLVLRAPTLRDRVHRVIKSRGDFGATDYEIEQHLGMRHQTASARRRELVLRGKAKDSGLRRKTGSGRNAVVWVACDEDPPARVQPSAEVERMRVAYAQRAQVYEMRVTRLLDRPRFKRHAQELREVLAEAFTLGRLTEALIVQSGSE